MKKIFFLFVFLITLCSCTNKTYIQIDEFDPLYIGQEKLIIFDVVGLDEYQITYEVNDKKITINDNTLTCLEPGDTSFFIILTQHKKIVEKKEIFLRIKETPKIIENYDVVSGKILQNSLNEKKLYLLGFGLLDYNNTKIIDLVTKEEVDASKLFIGLEEAYYYINKFTRKLDFIGIYSKKDQENIFVRINKNISLSGENDKYHEYIEMTPQQNITITDAANNNHFTLNKDQTFNIYPSGNYLDVFINGKLVYTTKNLLIIENKGRILFNSITRRNINPSYLGNFIISIKNGMLNVVNEIYIEDYLKTVVPSEMSSSFGLEALKAQAVCARTYAFNDIKNTKYFNEGYHVDDSVMSQVYNNTVENTLANQAIMETSLQILTYKNMPFSATFFSSCGGTTADVGEVWFPDNKYFVKDDDAYKGVSYNNEIDYQNEAECLKFYQDLNILSYDRGSRFYRWKYEVNLSSQELYSSLTILHKNYPTKIYKILNNKEHLVDKIEENLTFTSFDVAVRGKSGIIIALDINFDNVTYRVYGELNIRRLFKNIIISTFRDSNESLESFSFLPSAYFAIETTDKITFYGGGYGHGCGMSQYGAYGLSNAGYSYDEILQFYYNNPILKTMKIFESTIDQNEIFKILEK